MASELSSKRRLRDRRARFIVPHKFAGSVAAHLAELAELAAALGNHDRDPWWSRVARLLDDVARELRRFPDAQ